MATTGTKRTTNVHIARMTPLITPAQLMDQLPATPSVEESVLEGRRHLRRILDGEDQRFVAVVGPCSIHEESAAIEYAARLGQLSERVKDRLLVIMRVYFEKPRTTVGWKGLIYDPHLDDSFDMGVGLQKARKLLLKVAAMGLHTGTEFLDPIVPQYLADLVAWATIGARTTESQTHRQMASGLSMPVGFKNGTDGNTAVAINAMLSAQSQHGFLGVDMDGKACVVQTTGNPDGHLVLRGGDQGPNYGKSAIAGAQKQLESAGLRPRLIVDCSHGNSNKDHKRVAQAWRDVVEQRAEGNADIIGCMMESHLFPGNQKLNGGLSSLKYGVSITDSCVGWEETEALLNWAYDRLK